MNLPNKLTIFRMILIVPFVVFLLWDNGNNELFSAIALAIFILAALTDALDGYIARTYNLTTNFGKLMDPLADKLLVCSALICFVGMDRLPAWIVLIIIAREFAISAFRLVATEGGVVIAASPWGKLKTICQMIAVILLMLNIGVLQRITDGFVMAMVLLTLISLADYVIKNHKVITSGKM